MVSGVGFPPPSATDASPICWTTLPRQRSWRPVPSRRRASPCSTWRRAACAPTATGCCRSAWCGVLGDGTVVDRWDTLLRAPWRPLGGRRHPRPLPTDACGAPRVSPGRRPSSPPRSTAPSSAPTTPSSTGLPVAGAAAGRLPPPDVLRLCTLRLSRSLDPERERSHRLGDLCLRYGIPLTRRPRRRGRRRRHRRAPPPPAGRGRDHRPRELAPTSPAPPRRGRPRPASAVAGQHPRRRRRHRRRASSGGSSTSAVGPEPQQQPLQPAPESTGSSTTRSSAVGRRADAPGSARPSRPPSGGCGAGRPRRRRTAASQSGASLAGGRPVVTGSPVSASASMRSMRNQRSSPSACRPPAGTSAHGRRRRPAGRPMRSVRSPRLATK